MATILACGRLTKQKDYPTLFNAFALVRQEREDAWLTVLGEGEEREGLERLAGNLGISVNMPGFVTNPYDYMRRANCFVLSSAWEGFPNVLVEAMACGASVVATDCAGNGPREILEGGRWGRLVPVGCDGLLAAAILDTLHGPIDARERAMAFSVDAATERYLSLLAPARTP